MFTQNGKESQRRLTGQERERREGPQGLDQVCQQLLFAHVGNTNSLPFRAFALLPLRVFENCWNHETVPDFPHVADKAWSLHLFFPVEERIGKCAKSMYPAGI